MPEEVVLLSGVRIPVGKLGRSFKDVSARGLGALVIKEDCKEGRHQEAGCGRGHHGKCDLGQKTELILLFQ